MNRKYLYIYIGISYAICWGVSLLYVFFYDSFSEVFGGLTFTNPLVMFMLYSPNIAALVVYGLAGGKTAIKNLFCKVIPRRQDLIWYPIVIVIAILCLAWVHYGSIIFGVGVPERTFTITQTLTEMLKNFYEEAGIIGGVFGWLGFLLPYLQKKFNSNIKAGIATGIIFGIYVLPGYVISEFGLSATYPLYITQMTFFMLFYSFIFNLTKGNLSIYILLMGMIAAGSRMQLYYFNPEVQMLETSFCILAALAAYVYIKIRRIKLSLQVLPEYMGIAE